MNFSWTYPLVKEQKVKTYLRQQGVSRSLLAKIKFHGGSIKVNGKEENSIYQLQQDDFLEIKIPVEGEHEKMSLDETPIDIVFEDDHYLIVNKPAGIVSIPAQYHPHGTMANRVKNYYCQQGYQNRITHVVTRLDRDTTGLMIFARHGYAHARLDELLREDKLTRRYQALVTGGEVNLKNHGWIDYPIDRDLPSIIKRKAAVSGVSAATEYWLLKQQANWALVEIQLHTGRTHQIRVHFNAIGSPLLGDDLYGGDLEQGITRQALHCGEINFIHPFTGEEVLLQQPLPEDMLAVTEKVEYRSE